ARPRGDDGDGRRQENLPWAAGLRRPRRTRSRGSGRPARPDLGSLVPSRRLRDQLYSRLAASPLNSNGGQRFGSKGVAASPSPSGSRGAAPPSPVPAPPPPAAH